jgi:hypothetical protein
MNDTAPVLIAVMVAVVAIALFNTYVSIRVLTYRGLSRARKALQLAIIWLVPLVGVSLVHLILFARPPRPKDPGFEPVEHDSSPVGS